MYIKRDDHAGKIALTSS